MFFSYKLKDIILYNRSIDMKSFFQIFLAVAAVILLMAAGAFFFWQYQQKTAKSPNPVQLVSPTSAITKAEVSPIIVETTLVPTESATATPTP